MRTGENKKLPPNKQIPQPGRIAVLKVSKYRRRWGGKQNQIEGWVRRISAVHKFGRRKEWYKKK